MSDTRLRDRGEGANAPTKGGVGFSDKIHFLKVRKKDLGRGKAREEILKIIETVDQITQDEHVFQSQRMPSIGCITIGGAWGWGGLPEGKKSGVGLLHTAIRI